MVDHSRLRVDHHVGDLGLIELGAVRQPFVADVQVVVVDAGLAPSLTRLNTSGPVLSSSTIPDATNTSGPGSGNAR